MKSKALNSFSPCLLTTVRSPYGNERPPLHGPLYAGARLSHKHTFNTFDLSLRAQGTQRTSSLGSTRRVT